MTAKSLQYKCEQYMNENLRAPSQVLVRQWGKKMGLPPAEIEQISDTLKLRRVLGLYTYTH